MGWAKMLKETWVPKIACGHLLEAEQIHGLIVKLVHAAASVFRGRLADDGGGKLNRSGLLQTGQKQAP